jgi:hypothetical protein
VPVAEAVAEATLLGKVEQHAGQAARSGNAPAEQGDGVEPVTGDSATDASAAVLGAGAPAGLDGDGPAPAAAAPGATAKATRYAVDLQHSTCTCPNRSAPSRIGLLCKHIIAIRIVALAVSGLRRMWLDYEECVYAGMVPQPAEATAAYQPLTMFHAPPEAHAVAASPVGSEADDNGAMGWEDGEGSGGEEDAAVAALPEDVRARIAARELRAAHTTGRALQLRAGWARMASPFLGPR